ncbi:MAG: hypothetical protein ACNA8W_10795 [Bradymonadaceae bacterium]
MMILATVTDGIGFWTGIFWAVVGALIFFFIAVKLLTELRRARRQKREGEEKASEKAES